MDSTEDLRKLEVDITEKLDNFREAAERNFNEIYDKLGNQKLSEENEENLSLALTMMEALGIDILHLIRDYEDLVERKIYSEKVKPVIKPGMDLVFAHGFNIVNINHLTQCDNGQIKVSQIMSVIY